MTSVLAVADVPAVAFPAPPGVLLGDSVLVVAGLPAVANMPFCLLLLARLLLRKITFLFSTVQFHRNLVADDVRAISGPTHQGNLRFIDYS